MKPKRKTIVDIEMLSDDELNQLSKEEKEVYYTLYCEIENSIKSEPNLFFLYSVDKLDSDFEKINTRFIFKLTSRNIEKLLIKNFKYNGKRLFRTPEKHYLCLICDESYIIK